MLQSVVIIEINGNAHWQRIYEEKKKQDGKSKKAIQIITLKFFLMDRKETLKAGLS